MARPSSPPTTTAGSTARSSTRAARTTYLVGVHEQVDLGAPGDDHHCVGQWHPGVPATARLVAAGKDAVWEVNPRFTEIGLADLDRWPTKAVPAGSALRMRSSSSRPRPRVPASRALVHPVEPAQTRRLPGSQPG